VRLLKTGWRAGLAALGTGTAGTLLTQAYLIGLLWLGAGLVLEAGLTPGQLMSCYTLAGYLTGPMTALLGLNTQIQETLIATDRLFEIMDLELESDGGTIEFAPTHIGDIRFENVSFKHAGRTATLHDVSLALPAGRITALVGAAGCGKSSLLALLQRLYPPSAGRILIGGHDIRYFTLTSLRRHLAVVPQQTHLFAGTILENMVPGTAEPDLERAIRLSREVGVLEFIEKLPQGFFTLLTENGSNLSGGQRQKIALVRALYLDAPILLLDEPSSALDAEAEQSLVAVCERQRALGRTIVVATHTPAFLRVADQIVTLADGHVRTVADRPNLAIAVA
jgi:ATP-binding cassette, subfamily C, bacteriocin exporter